MCYKVSFIGCGPTASAPATATGRSRRVRNNCGAHIHGLLAPQPPAPPAPSPPAPNPPTPRGARRGGQEEVRFKR